MIPPAEARARIVAALAPVATEMVGLDSACGRVLAEDVTARVTQPPADVSAMDGYAVRLADLATLPAVLTLVGEAPAGGRHDARLQPGECVRIFTGGPLPEGADHIVIQENTTAEGRRITIERRSKEGQHIRRAGLDFRAGAVGLKAGRALTVRDIGLAAAMNRPWLRVRRRPRIAIVANGDELVLPGDPLGPDQILSSNGFALAACVRAWGGEAVQMGIVGDRPEALKELARELGPADLLVTSGGASVGDHDLIRSALGEEGLALDFWQIAMRPGKPLLFGRMGAVPVLGFPGNPVSTLICALLFLRPALEALLGLPAEEPRLATALLGRDLPANDRREEYLRATLAHDSDGRLVATPFQIQDSSMLSTLAQADCLVRRLALAPAAPAGTPVEYLAFATGLCGF
jgi:molybdopterin molybdotransferase